MITRAQAEALLTLAEALEACERQGWYVGASMRQGCGIAELTLGESELDTTLTAMDVRLQLSELLPPQVPLSEVASKTDNCRGLGVDHRPVKSDFSDRMFCSKCGDEIPKSTGS